MSCECKTTIQERIVAKHIEGNPEDLDVTASLGGFGFAINWDTGRTRLAGSLPITTHYVRKNKKGEQKKKTTKTSICFNYCPFCGKSMAEDERGGQ